MRRRKESGGRKGRRAFFAFALALSLGLGGMFVQPKLGWAQESERESGGEEESRRDSRAGMVEVESASVAIPRPRGWRIVRAVDEGAVAIFRPAKDREAQIEVRMSEEIPAVRWDRFVRTFDQEVLSGGFQVHQSGVPAAYGGRPGNFREHRLIVEDEEYRLVIWHTHHRDRAWVFTGFFRESRRDAYFDTFEEMLESVEWNR